MPAGMGERLYAPPVGPVPKEDWSQMRLIVAGAGRAGGSLALAAHRSRHEVVGILARRELAEWAAELTELSWFEPLPAADLLVVAARDDAISSVAEKLAPLAAAVPAAAHLSGFTSVAALRPLEEAGLLTASFHPLQTLPDPVAGAAALAGSWVAVTAPPQLEPVLFQLAQSLGCRPFVLSDDAKPLYHAAASSSSNYVVAALAVAAGLFELAGVPAEAARPLTESAVRNVYERGPLEALTGPIARGDRATVLGQLAAVDATPYGRDFRALAAATARLAGTFEVFPELR